MADRIRSLVPSALLWLLALLLLAAPCLPQPGNSGRLYSHIKSFLPGAAALLVVVANYRLCPLGWMGQTMFYLQMVMLMRAAAPSFMAGSYAFIQNEILILLVLATIGISYVAHMMGQTKLVSDELSAQQEEAMAEMFDVYNSDALTEGPKEAPYEAFRASRSEERRLFIIFRNHDYLILDYWNLESICNPPGVEPNDVVLLRFRGSMPRELRIEGRRLLEAVRHLWHHEVKWLKETPEGWDGTADSAAVITRIAVCEII